MSIPTSKKKKNQNNPLCINLIFTWIFRLFSLTHLLRHERHILAEQPHTNIPVFSVISEIHVITDDYCQQQWVYNTVSSHDITNSLSIVLLLRSVSTKYRSNIFSKAVWVMAVSLYKRRTEVSTLTLQQHLHRLRYACSAKRIFVQFPHVERQDASL